MKIQLCLAAAALSALVIACLSDPEPLKAVAKILTNPSSLFAGGSDSIIAIAVGNAEGTRSPTGQKTNAYYGHIDPGNAKHNVGTFSYQHCPANCTPAIADKLQLSRLQNQALEIQRKAKTQGVKLDKEALINGIDLANQAPLAALSSGGYIDRLKQAHAKGLKGSNAVLWARTQSYFDPDRGRWDAPGLGNNHPQIEADQQRRLNAISAALKQL